MRYTFKCPKCENVEEKNIPMDEYDEKSKLQMCTKCGSCMERVFDIPIMIHLPDGTYNKKNNVQGGWNG